MNSSSPRSAFVLGFFIALGLSLAGWFVASSIKTFRTSDRSVSVKGLSEREVPADLAIWPIYFNVTDNDLSSLQKKIQKGRDEVRSFLKSLGFEDSEISLSPPRITDRKAIEYGQEDKAPTFRYIAEASVLLRTGKIGEVRKGLEECDQLVQRGVVLSGNNYENRVQFIFTGLNQLKPEMIEEATVNARKAADQFAKDSGSHVGTIRRANQGYFEIQDRDSSTPDRKIVRVVTTVDYFLE